MHRKTRERVHVYEKCTFKIAVGKSMVEFPDPRGTKWVDDTPLTLIII